MAARRRRKVSRRRSPRLGGRVLERLMRYYRYLSQTTAREPIESITSARIAEALDIDATQVRKDFGAIGVLGSGRVGFDVTDLCRGIRIALGFDQPYRAVLIGAGHLGGALLAYPGFATYGLDIVAAFDSDRTKVGSVIGSCQVRAVRGLKRFIEQRGARLAIITTPGASAQSVADRVVSAGVSAIWNFSPAELSVPARVCVRNEHIAQGLAVLAYHLKR